MQDKHQILEREFYEVGYSSINYLNQQDLLQVLDKKSGKQFDRDLFQQLYERVDKDYQQKVKILDFINVILEAEEILKSKIDNSKNDLEEIHRQKRETLQKQAQLQGHERLNQYGIMDNSKLTIELIQITFPNLTPDDMVGAIFRCGDNQFESQIVSSFGNSGEYKYDERIEFQIETGMEDLEIKIATLNQQGDQILLGSLTIPLNRLKNQHKHEEVLDIYDNNGHIHQGKLFLTQQWIYSTEKYLKDIIKKQEYQIQQINFDLIDYEKDISNLYLPFPILIKYYKEGQIINNTIDQKQDIQTINIPKVQSPYRVSQRTNPEYDKGEIKAVKMNSIFDNSQNIYFILRKLFTVLLFFSTIIMFQKSQFIELLICFTFIIQYENKMINSKITSIYIIIMIASIVIELIWLYLYSSQWLDEDQFNNIRYPQIQLDLQKLVVILVWINQSVKICILVAFYFLYNYITSNNSRNQTFKDQSQDFLNNNQNELDTENNQLPIVTQNDIHSNNLTPNQKQYYIQNTDNTTQKTPQQQQQSYRQFSYQPQIINGNILNTNGQGNISTLNKQNQDFTPQKQQNSYLINNKTPIQENQQAQLYSLYKN